MSKRSKLSRPRFNLSTPSNKALLPTIRLIYRYKKLGDGKYLRIMYSTGLKVPKKHWNDKTHRTMASVDFNQLKSEKINKALSDLYYHCISIVEDNPDITEKAFKLELDYFTGTKRKPKQKEEHTVLEYFKRFLQLSLMSTRTIQRQMTVYNNIQEYQDNHLEEPITFDMMSPEFTRQLAKYRYRKFKDSQNTMNKLTTVLKCVVNDAFDNGYHSNRAYNSSKFVIPRIATKKHWLRLKDLQILESLEIVKENEQRILDLYLIGAYTGLRISDLKVLDYKKHFYHNGKRDIIKIHTYKGRNLKKSTLVEIPVLNPLNRILQRLEFDIPKPFEEQYMNRTIKKILLEAGITRLEETKKSIAGEIVREMQPLNELITFHSGRYGFINMMINDFGFSPMSVKKMTGQNLKTLEAYEGGDKSENAEKVGDKMDALLQ